MAVLKDKISKLISETGLTLQEISKLTGIDKSQLSRFKRGQFKKDSKNIKRLCEVLQKPQQIATEDAELILAVHDVWDGTLEGKQRLLAVLQSLKGWNS